MSAGGPVTGAKATNDLGLLAPLFRAAVEAAVAEARAAGFDAHVFETYRSQELQSLYYARGRTIVPPSRPVTNASSNLASWHGFGLAVDVISEKLFWGAPEDWFKGMAAIFKKHGINWGGDWKIRDLPHFQWGACKPSPSDLARELLQTQGLQAVWKAVGALGPVNAVTPVPVAAPVPAPAAPAAPAPAAAPAAPPPVALGAIMSAAIDADIEALNLQSTARNAAVILRARFADGVKFTSGRRDITAQARAMAENTAQNRNFIIQTYRQTPLRDRCHQWVVAHPEAKTKEQIDEGLMSVFNATPQDEWSQISKHLGGYAFDVKPVDGAPGEIIKAFIRKLPKLELFLEKEAGLVRWHAQFAP